ncbi:MAG: hypothetical protein ACLU9S_13590 [Oscillospiraceae bacterium]
MNILVQYGEATHISDEAGSELYYDTKTLLKRYHQELTVLAETNVLAKNMLPALEDLLEQWRQDAGVLTVGYSCAVDLSTGDTYVLSYLSSAIPTLYLEMDMASGKLIDFSVSANLCQEPEQVSADMWSCALSLAEYQGSPVHRTIRWTTAGITGFESRMGMEAPSSFASSRGMFCKCTQRDLIAIKRLNPRPTNLSAKNQENAANVAAVSGSLCVVIIGRVFCGSGQTSQATGCRHMYSATQWNICSKLSRRVL